MSTFEVAADHPVFAGHFPSRPIVPGVMLLEWVLTEVGRELGTPPSELRVREAKFFTPLAPGNSKRSSARCPGARGQRCRFEIRCQHSAIARGTLEWDTRDRA